MTSQPGKQTIIISIFQEVKVIKQCGFGQLIEYNMKNIFIEKSYTKCDRETISRPFSEKSKL